MEIDECFYTFHRSPTELALVHAITICQRSCQEAECPPSAPFSSLYRSQLVLAWCSLQMDRPTEFASGRTHTAETPVLLYWTSSLLWILQTTKPQQLMNGKNCRLITISINSSTQYWSTLESQNSTIKSEQLTIVTHHPHHNDHYPQLQTPSGTIETSSLLDMMLFQSRATWTTSSKNIKKG